MAKLKINGEKVTITAAPHTPLLWVLRDQMNLTGTKFGCGKGLCGACTVLLNGEAVRSCSIPISAAADADVTTIEGIATAADGVRQIGSALLEAWREEKVPQCGYCQPGQIMNAAGLLSNKADISEDEIKEGMAGNICRCGTYTRINNAVARAAREIKNA